MKNKVTLQNNIIIGMILLLAASRLMIAVPNLSPVAAMGLFGGAYFSKKYLAFLIPFLGLFLSNLFLNNVIYAQYYEGFTLFAPSDIFVYSAFALVILFGSSALKKVSAKSIFTAAIAGSMIFFVLTNFGAFMANPMYTKDVTGLIAAYTTGIPFFKYTVLGDLVFSGVLFGGFELIKRSYLSNKLA